MRPSAAKTEPSGRARRVLFPFFGYLIGTACVYWIFHDINGRELLRSLASIAWWWLLPSAALDLGAYFLVAWQWQLLLRPVGRLAFRKASRAVFAGRFANDVLPVQLGYVVRVYIASQDLRTGFGAIIPSLIIERLLDGAWLGVGILLLTFIVPVPSYIGTARDLLLAVITVGTMLVMVLSLGSTRNSKGRNHWTTWAPLERVWRLFGQVKEGVRAIARSRVLLATVFLAAAKLLVQGLAYHAVVRAYGLDLPIWKGLAVFLIAYLGITVPSTPAGVGVFQFCSVIGLELFGISKTAATGMSLVAFVVLTAPLALAGFYAVTRTGLNWRQLRGELGRLASRIPASAGSSEK